VLKNNKIRVFVTALITTMVMYSGYLVAEGATYKFENYGLGYIFVKYSYHEEMNDFFSDKIEMLLDTDMKDPNQLPPDEGDACSENNVSTYCVAITALDMYEKYLDTLNEVEGYIEIGILEGNVDIPLSNSVTEKIPILNKLTGVIGGGNVNISDIFQITGMRNEDLAYEKQYALDLMNMAIGAYNELRLAYPMHEKYDEVIVALTKYREQLESIRAKLSKMPPKFLDSTSASCK